MLIKKWTKLRNFSSGLFPKKKEQWEIELEKEIKRRKDHVRQRIAKYKKEVSAPTDNEIQVSLETMEMLRRILDDQQDIKSETGSESSILKPTTGLSDIQHDLLKFVKKKKVSFDDNVVIFEENDFEDSWDGESVESADGGWCDSPKLVESSPVEEPITPVRPDLHNSTVISLHRNEPNPYERANRARSMTPPLERVRSVPMERSFADPVQSKRSSAPASSTVSSNSDTSLVSDHSKAFVPLTPPMERKKEPRLRVDTSRVVNSFTKLTPTTPTPQSPYFYEKNLPSIPKDGNETLRLNTIPRKAASLLDIHNVVIPPRSTSFPAPSVSKRDSVKKSPAPSVSKRNSFSLTFRY